MPALKHLKASKLNVKIPNLPATSRVELILLDSGLGLRVLNLTLTLISTVFSLAEPFLSASLTL